MPTAALTGSADRPIPPSKSANTDPKDDSVRCVARLSAVTFKVCSEPIAIVRYPKTQRDTRCYLLSKTIRWTTRWYAAMHPAMAERPCLGSHVLRSKIPSVHTPYLYSHPR